MFYSLIFMYSPAYNLAFTALTYSKDPLSVSSLVTVDDETDADVNSVPGRALPIPCPSQGYHNFPMVDPRRGILQSVRESYWHRRRRYVHILNSSETLH